jgi:hypothetical protein
VSPEEVSLRDFMEARFDATDEKIAAGHEASAREHAEVRSDLGELRGDFREFKQYVYGEQRATAKEISQLKRDRDERFGAARGRWEILKIAVAVSAIGGPIAGLTIAAVRTFLFPA